MEANARHNRARKSLKGKPQQSNKKNVLGKPCVEKHYTYRLLDVLPRDVLGLIINLLDMEDLMRWSLTSKTTYIALWNLKLHDAIHECRDEMTKEWNRVAHRLADIASYGPKADYYDDHSTHDGRIKSSHSSDAYDARDAWECSCSTFPWRIHHLRVEYTYNPRDVDILSWYCDNIRIGYSML